MKKDVQDKLVSAIIGVIVGVIVVYGYSYYTASGNSMTNTTRGQRSFDPATGTMASGSTTGSGTESMRKWRIEQ